MGIYQHFSEQYLAGNDIETNMYHQLNWDQSAAAFIFLPVTAAVWPHVGDRSLKTVIDDQSLFYK